MAVSQKTYLELDDVVPSWIGAIVAVDCHLLTAKSYLVLTCCLCHLSHGLLRKLISPLLMRY